LSIRLRAACTAETAWPKSFLSRWDASPRDGSADLSSVEAVAREVAQNLKKYTLIVDKSTVPSRLETGSRKRSNASSLEIPYDVASNPEFLSEGTALHDFFHPDRIVLGVPSHRAEKLLRSVYAGIDAPILVTDVKSAELIKHASNSFSP